MLQWTALSAGSVTEKPSDLRWSLLQGTGGGHVRPMQSLLYSRSLIDLQGVICRGVSIWDTAEP